MRTKYIFITGGVLSSLGKGITAASIALLLEGKGLRVSLMKFDPYLNVDPGTMSPTQHGEVYVTEDGAETDLDLGHYFRYSNAKLQKTSSITAGQIYEEVIAEERQGKFLGQTVQVIPHITNKIKEKITNNSGPDIDVAIIEVGGTVGDIESMPFLEAIRQFQHEHFGLCITLLLTYIPYLKAAGELKTKPTQYAVQLLQSLGIIPHIVMCRVEDPLPNPTKEKISLLCGIPLDRIIEGADVSHIYEIPISLHKQELDRIISELLKLPTKPSNILHWENMVAKLKTPKETFSIGIVGKYTSCADAYKSLLEALQHSAIATDITVVPVFIDAEKIENLEDIPLCHGYIVAGGFGIRGWDGKICVTRFCRERSLPYLGICLGMQAMIVEFARNVLNLSDANSTEIDPGTSHPVISLLSKQSEHHKLGGTLRLGNFPCSILNDTKAMEIYSKDLVQERHRHRYEFNNDFKELYESNQYIISGVYEKSGLCEIIESTIHPWMVGVQFHPEFSSKPTKAHPLFNSFLSAVVQLQVKEPVLV
ncbi:MAG: CTP synthase [Chlamydiales bacterium]